MLISPALLAAALLAAVLVGAACTWLGAWLYFTATRGRSPLPPAPSLASIKELMAGEHPAPARAADGKPAEPRKARL